MTRNLWGRKPPLLLGVLGWWGRVVFTFGIAEEVDVFRLRWPQRMVEEIENLNLNPAAQVRHSTPYPLYPSLPLVA